MEDLGERLQRFWAGYSRYMRTQTRDTSRYGLSYVSGLLRVEQRHNMAHISRRLGIDAQDLQHFISNSPGSARPNQRGASAVMQRPEYQEEAGLIIDESADEKSGTVTAGAGRQHNGRTGQIDECQVGVFLTLATPRANLWLDGELFIPERWFGAAMAAHHKKAGIPAERQFQTRPELAWQMIQRAQQQRLVWFGIHGHLYGRSHDLRRKLATAQLEYYADVPADTQVYLCPPRLVYRAAKQGRRAVRPQVSGTPYQVRALLDTLALRSQTLELRTNERGSWVADLPACSSGRCTKAAFGKNGC